MKEQIFTVGDTTNHGVIKAFKIIENGMYAVCEGGLFNIKEIEKEKQPLFTTEDGKPIYEGDYYFAVTDETGYLKWQIGKNEARNNTPYGQWQFSTQEAAEKHIQENKPIFSYNKLKEIAFYEDIENGFISIGLDKLKEVINQK